MGWFLVCIIFTILYYILLWKTNVDDGFAIGIGLITFGLALILLASMIISGFADAKDYQSHYKTYQELSTYISTVEDIEPSKYEEISVYNADIYTAKNEGFMTKYLHNPLLKELPYIEGTGMEVIEEG
jgi:uncharacterized membrane protein